MSEDLPALLERARRVAEGLSAANRLLGAALRERWLAQKAETPMSAEVEEAIPGLASGAGPVALWGGTAALRKLCGAALHYAGSRAERPYATLGVDEINPRRLAEVGAASVGTLFVDPIDRIDPAEVATLVALARRGSLRLVLGVAGELGEAVRLQLRPAMLRITLDAGESISDGPGLREMMNAYEKKILARHLQAHGGNKTRTALALGITREGLHKKLSKHGL